MAIKPTGRGVPVAPATEIGGTEKTATAGRKFAVGDTAEVASSGPADVGATEQAVADVAQCEPVSCRVTRSGSTRSSRTSSAHRLQMVHRPPR